MATVGCERALEQRLKSLQKDKCYLALLNGVFGGLMAIAETKVSAPDAQSLSKRKA